MAGAGEGEAHAVVGGQAQDGDAGAHTPEAFKAQQVRGDALLTNCRRGSREGALEGRCDERCSGCE
jgi:hypothetical protein